MQQFNVIFCMQLQWVRLVLSFDQPDPEFESSSSAFAEHAVLKLCHEMLSSSGTEDVFMSASEFVEGGYFFLGWCYGLTNRLNVAGAIAQPTV